MANKIEPKCWDCGKEVPEERIRCDECIKNWKPKINDKTDNFAWSRKMRVERDCYAKEILQPLNKDGTPNKHFEKVYGKNKLPQPAQEKTT